MLFVIHLSDKRDFSLTPCGYDGSKERQQSAFWERRMLSNNKWHFIRGSTKNGLAVLHTSLVEQWICNNIWIRLSLNHVQCAHLSLVFNFLQWYTLFFHWLWNKYDYDSKEKRIRQCYRNPSTHAKSSSFYRRC